MSEINEALGVSGAGCTLTLDGKTWHFTALTKASQGEFDAWMEERAWRKYERAKKVLDAADAEKLFEHISAKIDRGEYSMFGGRIDPATGKPLVNEAFERAIKTTDGLAFLLQLMLKGKHPDASRADAERLLSEKPEGVTRILRQLYPNEQAPATATPTGASN